MGKRTPCRASAAPEALEIGGFGCIDDDDPELAAAINAALGEAQERERLEKAAEFNAWIKECSLFKRRQEIAKPGKSTLPPTGVELSTAQALHEIDQLGYAIACEQFRDDGRPDLRTVFVTAAENYLRFNRHKIDRKAAVLAGEQDIVDAIKAALDEQGCSSVAELGRKRGALTKMIKAVCERVLDQRQSQNINEDDAKKGLTKTTLLRIIERYGL